MVLWCLSNLVFRDAFAFVVRCNLCSSWPGLVLPLAAEPFSCFFHHLFLCFISDGRALAFAVRDIWVYSMLSWKTKISQDGSCACSMSCFVALLSYGLTFFVSTAPVDQCDIIGYAVFFVVTGESQTWEVTGERSQVRVRGEMCEVSGGRWDVRVLCFCSHVAFCGWICVWMYQLLVGILNSTRISMLCI